MGTFQTSQFQIIPGFFDQPHAGPSEAGLEPVTRGEAGLEPVARGKAWLDPARAAGGLTDLRSAGVSAI